MQTPQKRPASLRIAKKNSFKYLQIIATLFALVGVIASIVDLFQFKSTLEKPVPREDQIKVVQRDFDAVKNEIATIKDQIGALSKIPDQSKLSVQLERIENSIKDLQDRFSGIENIILRDPQKSLEIPLLRKDIDDLKESSQLSLASLRADIERAYTIFIGTIAALFVTVIAPGITNMFKKQNRQLQEDKVEGS